jgi:hypothetical protein
MRRIFGVSLLLFSFRVFSSCAVAQSCTSYVFAPVYAHITEYVGDLSAGDFEARMGNTVLPVRSATQDFSNRLLVLLEVDEVYGDSKVVGDVLDLVPRLVREAPEGRRIAFGIYARKAVFSEHFSADPKERIREVNDVIEQADTMGKDVAMYDSLHQALQLFGPHQPGDTVLLIADPYDNNSRRSRSDIMHEFAASGTRFAVMVRQPLTRVGRDFPMKNHEGERDFFGQLSLLTGGYYTDFKAHLLDAAWMGYTLAVELPRGLRKPAKWKLRLRNATAHEHAKVIYPEKIPPCSASENTPVEKKDNARQQQLRGLAVR